MVQRGTKVVVADNSGALEAEIFGLYGREPRSRLTVGHVVKVAIKRVIPNNGKVKKGEVHFALIVRTRYAVKDPTGCARAGENAVVLLGPDRQPMGGMASGYVSRKAIGANESFKKVASMAEEVY